MTDELKPVRCGCGGEAVANDYIDRLENKTEHFVHCVKCGICSADYDTKAEAIEAWNRAMGWVSLKDKIVDDGIISLLRAIMQPHEVVAMKVNLKGIHRAIDTLPEREQKILMMYYCENKTLEEIGKEFGVTRERVRQIRDLSLRKLRHPTLQKWYCEVKDE